MQRVRDRFREAEAELRASRDLYLHGDWFWRCFTCQQAAEKALKAVGEHFRHYLVGHNLNLLVQALENYLAVPEEVRRAIVG